MTRKPHDGDLRYPFPEPPQKKGAIEIADGVLWIRLPLPFALDHINIFLIDDGDGWAVLDTGIADRVTKELWSFLIAGRLGGRKLTRLIATHYHPDHIGLAGWFAESHGLPLITTLSTYLQCATIALRPGGLDAKPYRDFYFRNGLTDEVTGLLSTQGHGYMSMVTPLPPTFERIVAGDILKIGGRTFEVLTGDGHAPEQAMLYCADEKLFFGADQVLDKISPNIAVWAIEPNGDPLGLFLRSLDQLKARLPEDVLVMPSHHMPFVGLGVRADQLAAHHKRRCAILLRAARKPKSAAQLVPTLFSRKLDAHEMSFAFSEVLAHVNYLLRQGRLAWAEPEDGVERVIASH
jgi:glyoxylase-like metal-dependent hydrolase (beta-lactamase superfamily II)